MTLPEFMAAQKAFGQFHGMKGETEPSDAEYWRAVNDAPSRPSIH